MDETDPSGDVLAVAISGRRSRRAVQWAAETLIPYASRVILVHVTALESPEVSTPSTSPPVTSPFLSSLTSYLSLHSGNNSGSSSARISGEEDYAGHEIVEFRSQSPPPSRSKEERKKMVRSHVVLCDTDKQVVVDVVEAEDVAGALLDYALRNEVKNLVLGCASFVWLNRLLKARDVPEAVLQSAPESLNVFLVSRSKIVLKLPSDSIAKGVSTTWQIDRNRSNLPSRVERETITPRSRSMPTGSSYRARSRSLPTAVRSRVEHRSNSNITSKEDDDFVLNTSLRNSQRTFELPSTREEQQDEVNGTCGLVIAANATRCNDSVAEVVRLKARIENTYLMLHHACGELAKERKKLKSLWAARFEEKMKNKEALEREQLAMKMAEEEKAKHLEALRELEEAKQVLIKEALDRHIAEINANKEYKEKLRIMNTLFSSDNMCRSYSSYEIEAATCNFAENLKIGHGGYGNVYKCHLDQIPVAIKVLRKDKMEKMEQFLREVEVLTKLRHPHIVILIGVCAENGCLIYEYMENGSLEDQLFGKNGSQPLPWAVRFRILYEVACTLAFLHSSKPKPVIHCDLKPGNILLDGNFVSKIGDVGLAKLLSDVAPDDITEYAADSKIIGTYCYMDPEYERTGTIRPKSDLYAFGVVALQMLTKREPLGLVHQVESALKDGTFTTILDKSVTGWPIEASERLARLALKCAAMRCRERPDLGSEVIPELEQILNSLATRPNQEQVNHVAPSQYYCPLLREVMDDPYIAMDGFTYERRAIEAWLARHDVSPMTRLKLPSACIIPNLTMRSAIQEWRSKMDFLAIW